MFRKLLSSLSKTKAQAWFDDYIAKGTGRVWNNVMRMVLVISPHATPKCLPLTDLIKFAK